MSTTALAVPARRKIRVFRCLSTIVTVVGFVFVILQAFDPHGHIYQNTNLFGIGLVILCGYWIPVAAFLYIRTVCRVTDQALASIPSLAEIELQLRREGYDPSIQDVVAVEQHLKSERNQSIVVLGALVIGPQLLARQARGESLL